MKSPPLPPRLIHKRLPSIQRLEHVSLDARLLYVALLMEADDEGQCLMDIPALRANPLLAKSGMTMRRFADALQALEVVGCLRRYNAGGYPMVGLCGFVNEQPVWLRGKRLARAEPPPEALTEEEATLHEAIARARRALAGKRPPRPRERNRTHKEDGG